MPNGSSSTLPVSTSLAVAGAVCQKDPTIYRSTGDNNVYNQLSNYKQISAHSKRDDTMKLNMIYLTDVAS